MPTLQSHTHLQFARATTQPKIAKEYGLPTLTERLKKRKHIPPKLAIRNAGESADMKVITLNKLTAKRKVKCLENRHQAICLPLCGIPF